MQQHIVSDTGTPSLLCRHHWVIETPNGATSHGSCKRCGVQREFRNSTEDLLWDSDGFNLGNGRYRGKKQQKAASA
jgi:hypothetical protein